MYDEMKSSGLSMLYMGTKHTISTRDVRLIRMPCCIAGNFDRCKFLRFCRRTCFSENKICEKLIKLEIDDVIMLAVSVHTT